MGWRDYEYNYYPKSTPRKRGRHQGEKRARAGWRALVGQTVDRRAGELLPWRAADARALLCAEWAGALDRHRPRRCHREGAGVPRDPV